MIEPIALLQNCLCTLRELSGAGSVSLCVLSSAGEESEPMLLQEGELPPVPELEGELLAEELLRHSKTARRGFWPYISLEVDSADPDCLLMALPTSDDTGTECPVWNLEDRRRLAAQPDEAPPTAWVGLRFPPGQSPSGWPHGEPLVADVGVDVAPESGIGDPPRWISLLALVGLLSEHVTQFSARHTDRISGLPDRRELQSLLEVAIEGARRDAHPLSLLWVNPDDFIRVNQLFGSAAGDRVVREIANRLRSVLRTSDLVARYGGVTFAVILGRTGDDGAGRLAGRILEHLSAAAYLDGAMPLDFSIGIATFEPGADEDAVELVRRADQALSAAKRQGGATIAVWTERTGTEQVESFDRMAGIFTGDAVKDYRNMVVLWDTVQTIARCDDLDQLATEACGILFDSLKPDGIGLFALDVAGALTLQRGLTRQPGAQEPQNRQEALNLDADRLEWIRQAMEEGSTREGPLPVEPPGIGPAGPGGRCRSVPLIAGKERLGSLYLEWGAGSPPLDASDLFFLNGIGLQLAIAWDRIRLVEIELGHQELEKRQLQAELGQLRRAVRQAKLEYRSPEMEVLMNTARRVARSNATVLVTGPSGTGKELIARTVHELSDRRDKPFVIVDCSSIPTTLIESELFGYERGAYTGAQQRRRGRLAEAHQGTVLLDEIGELPLEVQSKLLRFVQEKQFTSVGGSGSRTVDVRILAATNRDLLAEAQAGRFREDLYYRLNVVHLAIPPLKDRRADIVHLAQYFLKLYSAQNQRKIRGLSPEAGECLLDHSWPGNVRELQNRILQAVLLCEGSILTAEDLGLEFQGPKRSVAADSIAEPSPQDSLPFDLAADTPTAPGEEVTGNPWESAAADSLESLLEQLGRHLGRQIGDLAEDDAADPAPIGRWLSDELLLAADRAAEGVRDRGAAILDLAPTTYRRRLEKAQSRSEAEAPPGLPGWEPIRASIERLVELAESTGSLADLPARAERALLTEIVALYPGQTRLGSSLLGVTAPTFRRRVAAMRRS